MARRRSRSVDASAITNELDSLLLEPMAMPTLHPMTPFQDLTAVEDTRQFHPEAANRPPLSLHHATELDVYEPSPSQAHTRAGGASRVPQRPRPYSRTTEARGPLSPQIAFRAANRVAICIRRKQRRETLFALRKTGRGTRRNRRYNAYSQVRC